MIVTSWSQVTGSNLLELNGLGLVDDLLEARVC
jgi:hypothetical protein